MMPESPKPAETPEKLPLQQRAWAQYQANRRRIGTVAAILVALLLTWHAVTGRNGISSWQQKRAEDKALAAEIDQLTAENAHLSQHVDRLKSDPGAIEYEARLRLRYARPNEIIYALPAKQEAPKPMAPAQ
jgi:cell division protein FtsB